MARFLKSHLVSKAGWAETQPEGATSLSNILQHCSVHFQNSHHCHTFTPSSIVWSTVLSAPPLSIRERIIPLLLLLASFCGILQWPGHLQLCDHQHQLPEFVSEALPHNLGLVTLLLHWHNISTQKDRGDSPASNPYYILRATTRYPLKEPEVAIRNSVPHCYWIILCWFRSFIFRDLHVHTELFDHVCSTFCGHWAPSVSKCSRDIPCRVSLWPSGNHRSARPLISVTIFDSDSQQSSSKENVFEGLMFTGGCVGPYWYSAFYHAFGGSACCLQPGPGAAKSIPLHLLYEAFLYIN